MTKLSDAAEAVLKFHQTSDKPDHALRLVGDNPFLSSNDKLDAAYTELLEAGKVEMVNEVVGFEPMDGSQVQHRTLYRCTSNNR